MEKVSLKNNVNKKLEQNFIKEKMNPKMQNLIKRFNLSEKEVKMNLSSLKDTLEELDNCSNCKNLSNCPNHLKGFVYYPNKDESAVTFNYIKCKKKKAFESKLMEKDSWNLLYSARMKDIDPSDKKRAELIKWLTKFYKEYDSAKENKGLYLHGSFGSGKTFLIAALLNELKSSYDVNFEIVYFPELLRTLKDDFNLVDAKVRYYSSVEILLLDDIGAEKVSEWGRDEILGTILQSRMNNHLTTFFTSNLDINELENHLACSKDSIDKVKARRIIERIKQLTIDIELISISRRS